MIIYNWFDDERIPFLLQFLMENSNSSAVDIAKHFDNSSQATIRMLNKFVELKIIPEPMRVKKYNKTLYFVDWELIYTKWLEEITSTRENAIFPYKKNNEWTINHPQWRKNLSNRINASKETSKILSKNPIFNYKSLKEINFLPINQKNLEQIKRVLSLKNEHIDAKLTMRKISSQVFCRVLLFPHPLSTDVHPLFDVLAQFYAHYELEKYNNDAIFEFITAYILLKYKFLEENS